MIDYIFGQGGIDQRFTDWDTARNFVIFDTIVNNPRLTDETKIRLQDMEQQAYEETHGQFFKSERQEIGEYYNYLKNQFPSITDDQRFLAIFDSADQVKAGESSIGVEDVIDVSNDTKMTLAVVALAGFTVFMLFRD